MTPLELLARELQAEDRNGMKFIIVDWGNIKKEYFEYKHLGLTTQESFYCSLMDNGYLTLEDLKYDA